MTSHRSVGAATEGVVVGMMVVKVVTSLPSSVLLVISPTRMHGQTHIYAASIRSNTIIVRVCVGMCLAGWLCMKYHHV